MASKNVPTTVVKIPSGDHEAVFKHIWSDLEVGRKALEAVKGIYDGVLPDEAVYEIAVMLARFRSGIGQRVAVKTPADSEPSVTPDEYSRQWERIFSQIGELEAAMLNDNPNSETGQNTAVKRFISQQRATVKLMTQSLSGQTIRTPEGLAVPDGTHYKSEAHPLAIKQLAVRLIELSKEHRVKKHFVKLARLLEALGYYNEDEERDKGHYDWTERLRNLV